VKEVHILVVIRHLEGYQDEQHDALIELDALDVERSAIRGKDNEISLQRYKEKDQAI
jgi:hypothetical protein